MKKHYMLAATFVLALSGCTSGAAALPEASPSQIVEATPSPSVSAKPKVKHLVKPKPSKKKETKAKIHVDEDLGSCASVKKAGLGPYHVGQAEYDYYQDNDKDGVVCE